MKRMIVPETIVSMMVKYLIKKDKMDEYEIFIVRDEDYEEAMEIVLEGIPDDARLELLEMMFDAD